MRFRQFLSTLGWDWVPAIRDRDSGIWQKVFLSATGPVIVKEPLVTTDLPLPKTDSTDVGVQATVENVTDQLQKGVLDTRDILFFLSIIGFSLFSTSVIIRAHRAG